MKKSIILLMMILLMMSTISITNITANEKEKKAEYIEYNGKKGYFVPPDMFRLFNRLLTNNPILEEENAELRDWATKKHDLFKKSIDEYFRLKRVLTISIGFSVGSGFLVLAMIIGIVTYAVLSYYDKLLR